MAWDFFRFSIKKRQVTSTTYQHFLTIFSNNKYTAKLNDFLLFMLFKD